jgi:hypothetical protein
MAKYSSVNTIFEIDTADGGSLSSGFSAAYLTGPIEVDFTKGDVVESTPYGASAFAGLRGVISRMAPFNLEGFYDDTASTGPDAILNIQRVTHAVTRSFSLTLGTGEVITGECWITNYKVTSSVGNYHTFSATITPTGTIAWASA